MSEPIELDEAAREVIAAGREGVVPNEFVAERLRRSVDRTLRGSAPPSHSRSRAVPILVALGAAGLGGALYANERARQQPEPPPRDDAASQAVPKAAPPARAAPPLPPAALPTEVPTEPSEPSALAPAPPASVQAPTSGRAERPPMRSQQLSEEIELLARVNAAVNAGDGGRALELLGEYDRKFRPSILGEERAAATVLALCAAGRTAEARAAAERFARSSPRSPLRGRIAKSCASSP